MTSDPTHDPTAQATSRRTVADELRDHVGLVLTAGGALLLITRVYISSGRETGTSLAMLRSAGLLPTALGVVTTLLPVLAVVAATGLALVAMHDVVTGRRPARGLLAGVVAAVAAAFVPLSSATATRVAVLLLLPLVAVLLRWRGLLHPGALWGAATAGLLGLNVLTSGTLWLPAERVSVTAGDGSTVRYVGYVLEEGDRLQVLHHDPRLVLNLDPEAVTERVVCRLGPESDDATRDSVLSALLGIADIGSPRGGAPDC